MRTYSEYAEALDEMLREHGKARADYRTAVIAHAKADDAYRKAKAVAYTKHVVKKHNDKPLTVDHLKALVDTDCEVERLRARLADAEREACYLAAQGLGRELSAIQTLLNHSKEELKQGNYDPRR